MVLFLARLEGFNALNFGSDLQQGGDKPTKVDYLARLMFFFVQTCSRVLVIGRNSTAMMTI